jgi:membrane fusion protein (multidrug efflux system)
MSAPSQNSAASANGKRRVAMLGISAACAALVVGYGLYWGLHARYFVSTDNAYVAGNVVQVTPQVTGTVLAIRVEDTDFVKAGDPLVKLDPADAQVALDQAQAQLGQTVREVRTLFANDATYQANVKLREADLSRVQADVTKAQEDLTRRQGLTAKGAVSKEELEHAQTALTSAKSAQASAEAAVVAAREQLAANRTLIDGTSVEQHPNVQRAAARVREAYLALKRADLPAPVTGYIAKRSVQVGQRVPAGSPLMSIVPLDQVWVDANFKEVQLADMRIGQPVKVRADLYGGKVEYDGRIVGLGAGTGAAFALLPAQNATGNWIKVVQRVPVRVALDPKQLQEHPLRIGLSLDVSVDVHDQSGVALAAAPRASMASATEVFSGKDAAADALVKQIITHNIGAHLQTAASGIARR